MQSKPFICTGMNRFLSLKDDRLDQELFRENVIAKLCNLDENPVCMNREG